MESAVAAPRIRWLRALLAGFLGELALMVVLVAIYAVAADPRPAAELTIPLASFPLLALAGYWAARSVPGHGMLQGAIAGAFATLLYLAMSGTVVAADPKVDFASMLIPAYLLSHALKISGGAFGGWLVARKGVRPAA